MSTTPSTTRTSAARDWQPDVLLSGYQSLTLPLPGAVLAEGESCDPSDLVGTLVRRNEPTHRRAILYVHGWADYFFQTHLADFCEGLGFDFHAVELRRYGRSRRPGQLPGYITDMDDYAAELDAALEVIRESHDCVVLMGHSTGGLVAALWADRRPGAIDGLVLNSPWIDLQASDVLGVVAKRALATLSSKRATHVIPLPDNGFYLRSIDAAQGGEWVLRSEWKGGEDWAVRIGWLSAVLAGHGRIAHGLSLDVPVLLCTSRRSDFSKRWSDALTRADVVLDVDKIRRRATKLGPCVTMCQIEGGLHDLALSAPAAREAFFDQIRRWVGAYLD